MNKKSDQKKSVSAEYSSVLDSLKESSRNREDETSDWIYQDDIILDYTKGENNLHRYYIHHYEGQKPKPYNLRWLSVAAIELEMEAAFFEAGDSVRLYHHVFAIEAYLPDLLYNEIRKPEDQFYEYESKKDYSLIFENFYNASIDASYLIQKKDQELVDLIRSTPETLLKNLDVLNAVSRWRYAATFSPDIEVRKKANENLKKSVFPSSLSDLNVHCLV